MRIRTHVLGLLAALVLGIAGCQDAVTAPEAMPEEPVAPALPEAAKSSTASPYGCFISVATPNGPQAYRYWRMRLDFPKRALAANGDTAIYRFRRYGPGKRIEQLANCVVPRTDLALQMVSRRFQGPANKAVPLPGDDSVGVMSTRDCYLQPNGVWLCDGIEGGGGGGGSYCQENPTAPACVGGYPEEPYIDPCQGDYNCSPGGGGPDPCLTCTPTGPIPCATGDRTIDDPAVQMGFRDLWNMSNPNANLAQRVERGGWLIRKSDGTFGIEIWPLAGNYCGMDGFVPHPTQGAVVGFVHTHPYQIDELVLNCASQIVPYKGLPSSEDRTQSATFGTQFGYGTGLPGYIIDANGITKFVGLAYYVDQRHSRCGF